MSPDPPAAGSGQFVADEPVASTSTSSSSPPSAVAPPLAPQSSGDSNSIPLSERQLSDLTDLEIASLTQQIKAESANVRPLIGALEPLERFKHEYDSERVRGKIEWLGKSGWTGLRRSRGDGDCFYRSFAFSFLERLVPLPPSSAQLSLAKIESLLPLLDQAWNLVVSYSGFAKDIYQDFYEPMRGLLVALGSNDRSKRTATHRPASATLEASFNDPEVSNSIVVFLRLLTSAYLRANADDFVPFLFALDDDPRFFEGGVPTMEQFCGFHVEAVNKEADHVQITALSRALRIGLRIAYLDQSTGKEGEVGEVDFVEFEVEGEEKTGVERLDGALLYTVNHYDVMYR
ncbi:BZ3500_MvSof-1268-A1-R1_Chr12-3g04063 [Microbotryum saponariae]|uniref:ubiquitinyl hydrolase 1 n=1 Tax=Microbotryum saponariae TaxID=289078 RepID=A0A2X0L7B6_9BASI|nr:BZ3500_MvSof-1268-A1-R1_Chr12-3g04063 [Microbotryum saponariae]SDA02624.1 BZ3501_MvSof-1269-A2-R1_Chr12-3g03718 [Microbotryum saponariae]